MNKKISSYIAGVLLLVACGQLFSQEIKISNNLTLHKLSDRCYMHTQKNNNGIVYITNKEAVIVSTPDSDTETQNLISWVKNVQKAEIVGYVIDRWHPDAMQGLDVVKENNIISYANKRTRKIAKQKGLPVAEVNFKSKKTIKVGQEIIVCHFLGEAHTKDGIVVWIPSEKVLFGGNEIRNYNGWIGNIGDANLQEWSKTAAKIKEHYGTAKIVVPGHGEYGGVELIDYTIALYKLPRNDSVQTKIIDKERINPYNDDLVIVKAEFDSIENGVRILTNAKVIVQDGAKYIEIESPQITLQESKKRVDSQVGTVKIYDKKDTKIKLRTDVNYNRLIIFEYDEVVGLVVVVKEITNNNS